MFKHYLITRFNLRNPKWKTTKNDESLLSTAWMKERFWLFENFCLPSITAQTNQNFEWLIYLDTTTEALFKTRIEELTAQFSNIHLFFIDGMAEYHSSITDYISKDSVAFPHIITSRIDNDDCISKYFIEEIQSKFNFQDYMAIDIIKGYSLEIKPAFRLGKKEHVFNPFISLIEKNEKPKTVWMNEHQMWKKEDRIITVRNKRLWLSIIHQQNKVNEFDGYGNVNWEQISNDFIVSKSMSQTIKENLIPENKWRFLSFRNKWYVKS